MSSCENRKRPDINLQKIAEEIGIVGCPGEPYYATKFDINLEKIGSEIIFDGSYSEFAVINEYSLFVIYRELNTVNSKYELHGCIYYLPSCEDQNVFVELRDKFYIKNIFDEKDNLKNLEYFNIISFTGLNGAQLYDENDTPLTSIDDTHDYNKNNIYYKYNPVTGNEKSYEDYIIYKSVVNPGTNYESLSKECTLKIINCYKSCSECYGIGDAILNNCKECKTGFYFLDDKSSKMCLDSLPDNYYLDNSDINNILYKKCYESCKTCTNLGSSSSHRCLDCYQDKGYYPFNSITSGLDTLYNCYLSVLPPDGYYFDNNRDPSYLYPITPYFKNCNNILTCLSCSQELVESGADYMCKKCDINNDYYALFENDDSKKYAKCLQPTDSDIPNDYFLDRDAGRYRKCYPTCETCSENGNDEHNNCDRCKSGFSEYVADPKTCKCEYNFYYQINSVTNTKTFQCTIDFDCPSDYPYLIINSQNIRQCVSNCPSEYPYIYNMQCFNHKLNGTSFDDDSTEGIDDFDINNDQCIINDYITSTIDKEKIKNVTQDFVNNYITEYSILDG